MRRVFCRFVSLLLSLLLLLPVLNARAEEITVTNYASTAFRDPYTTELLGKGAGLKAVCGQHTYIFPGLVNEKIARTYVAQAEAVFTWLADFGLADRPMKVHLVSGSHPVRVDGDTVYMSLSAFRSMEYVTGLTQLYFGVDVVHGLLYAVSCEAAEALGIEVEAVPVIDIALLSFCWSGAVYADMSYPCFTEPYTTPAMKANVKALARDFYASLTPEERGMLLTDYSNEAFYTRLNEYLTGHGLPRRKNEHLWGVSFHAGGPSIAVCWESAYASLAVAHGYEDIFGSAWYGASSAPLASTYADLLRWVEYLEGMLSHLHEHFAPYISFRRPMIIFDDEYIGVLAPYHDFYTYGYYLHNSHTIYTGAIEVVDHEYVHALVVHEGINMDMNEVLAYTYSTLLMPQEWSADWYTFTYDYEERSNPRSENHDPAWYELLTLARRSLGREPDLENLDDLRVMMDIVTLHRSHAAHASLQEAYSTTIDQKAAKMSYWCYLLRTYGEEAALTAALSDDPVTHLGKPWDALADDWISWLEETYPMDAP